MHKNTTRLQKTQPSCKKDNLSGKKATWIKKATWKHNLGCKKRQPGCLFVNKQDMILFLSWSCLLIIKELPFSVQVVFYFHQVIFLFMKKGNLVVFLKLSFSTKRRPDNLNKKWQLRLSFRSCLFQKNTT